MSVAPTLRVFVLGGAGGIGAAGVRALVEAGHRVAVADIAPVPPGLGAELTMAADAGVDNEVNAAVRGAVDGLGGLDAAWSHAGIQLLGTVESMALEDLDRSYLINLRAHAALARAAIPHLRAAGGGSLLFTASGAGLVVDRAAVPYGTMK